MLKHFLLFVSACPKCIMPFEYEGKNYTNCVKEDSAQSWCPVAAYLPGNIVENSWEFCNHNCNHSDSDRPRADDNELCESTELLHKYLQLYFDKSTTNPRIIAENLQGLSCPFKCQHQEYFTQLVYKKHVGTLGKDRVRLIIDFDGKTDIQNIYRSLLYTTDMFVSDIGSAFGFLLGVSLIDLISHILESLGTMSRMRRSWTIQMYHLGKWSCTLCFIVWIISSALSQDFVDLLPKLFASSGDARAFADVLELDADILDVGFLKGN